MNNGEPCPCCGQAIALDAQYRWNPHSRVLTGNGGATRLTEMQSRIFSKLWQLWPSGRMISLDELMDHCYADDPDGGVDSRNIISVQISFIRKRIEPLGISVRGYHGYRLYAYGKDSRALIDPYKTSQRKKEVA
jgi:DNA-binding response OmpR family regulator